MENNATHQDVLSRATNLPLISSAYEMAGLVYASTKENHPYVKVVLDWVENGVKHVSEMAVNGTQPFLSKLEPQVSVASHYASKSLDKLEEKLPFLHQTADQVMFETQELVSSKVADVKEAVAKAVQDGKEMIIDTRMGKLAMSGVEVVLEKSEELLDYYLPMTDEELAKIAESTPEGTNTTHESQDYFVQLGSLSTKLQHRAYQYAVAKMKAAREHIQNTFNPLCQAVGQIESHTLAMSYHVIQQLQMAYKNLIRSIQDLPSIFCQNIEMALYIITKTFRAPFTGAHSFKDLYCSLMSQDTVQTYIDDIMNYVEKNTQFPWLVAPFSPRT